MVTATATSVRDLVASVPDPEIPVVTIEDLGILRDVRVGADGAIEVDITPTYSGCPAMDAIRADVEQRLVDAGHDGARVRLVLAPAWTTDWISDEGRRKLAEFGIAPPSGTAPHRDGPVPLTLSVRCPRCGSPDTRELSRFGSTACKALWRCDQCSEPFDHFKAL
jgi:ring-1,2-phenylacetyl-CoA epoxidase subunit PaaD